MVALVADRFVCEETWSVACRDLSGIDTATGTRVDLHFEPVGAGVEQDAWANACAVAMCEPRRALIDFGCLGTTRRFTATLQKGQVSVSGSHSTPVQVLEWLEWPKPSSPRILVLAQPVNVRDIRLRGFVPLSVSLLARDGMAGAICRLVAGRSVALLDDQGTPDELALALLGLRRAGARDVFAIVTPRFRSGLVRAAEGRAAYGVTGGARPFPIGRGVAIADPRTKAMVDQADRLVQRGRHAAAERMLKAAAAAFERRGGLIHAGETRMRVGRLLLERGRAAEARAMFEVAHDRFQDARAPGLAVHACRWAGVAQTDLGLLREGESACRAAYAAASAIADPVQTSSCAVALARNLFWQERHADAAALLESVVPGDEAEACARYWCLAARLRLVGNDLQGARLAVERARTLPGGQVSPAVEATIRTGEAAIQARLGDVDALAFHVRAGIAAARAAHLPLSSLRLRFTLIEGLLDAGRTAHARACGAHLKSGGRAALPALLKHRADRILERLTHDAEGDTATHVRIYTGPCGTDDIDSLTQMVLVCHDLEDEREAIGRAAGIVRKQTHALGVGIFGRAGTEVLQFGVAGAVSQALARRAIDLGQPIGPEPAAGSVEAAAPIRYLGRVIGAVVSRWSVEGPECEERVMACGAAGAAVCAPLVYVLLERQTPVPAAEAGAELLGTSAGMEGVRRAIARAANAPFTVLIEGESGSGKELVARAIHRTGCRRERRFSALNCAALPEDLMDAELFGHARGAFTGALTERIGLFESADGGTVFLDEVGELSPRAQAKLLRVLQEGEIRRVGENVTRVIDARLVAATNRSLRAEATAGRFREDLLYRLDVIRIVVPPLRERVEDIPLLAKQFWRHAAERVGSRAVLGQGALAVLARYDWPGNVRELQNVLTGLLVAVPSRGVVGAAEMPAAIARATRPMSEESLESARFKFEQRLVRATLARTAGHRGKAATALGLSRQGLAKLMQRLHLDA